MNALSSHLPRWITLGAGIALALHGPIEQLANYHAFADQTHFAGIPHACDVLSNLGFALVALWGWLRLQPQREHPALAAGWPGYRLFLLGLFLTAFGSSFYHLEPDNARLVWDRLPIAWACSGLLVAVHAETAGRCPITGRERMNVALLAVGATLSVGWWYWTDLLSGHGDLRPYLLLQGLPIVLVPLWQGMHGAPRADRLAFAGALLLYVLAKTAELNDHALQAVLGGLSGHTLKHLLATAAAYVIVARLARRVGAAESLSAPAAQRGDSALAHPHNPGFRRRAHAKQ
jgi:hypothetical protein